MPTLIVEDVPTDVYELLQQRAAACQRTLPDETVRVLRQALRDDLPPTPRLPELIPNEEISAPCDLPRSSRPVTVLACNGQPRLPDLPAADLSE
jgi:plasmid stability protein